MTLYEIADNYRNFFEAVESGDVPENAVNDTLEALDGELDSKVENIACMIKNWLTLAEDQKKEANNLKDLADGNEKRAKRWREWLTMCLTTAGKKKVETARCCVTIRKGQNSTQVDDINFVKWAIDNNRDDLLTYKDPTPNKSAIKVALESGDSVPYTQIVTGKDGVTIK